MMTTSKICKDCQHYTAKVNGESYTLGWCDRMGAWLTTKKAVEGPMPCDGEDYEPVVRDCTTCDCHEVRSLQGWPTYYCVARGQYMTRQEATKGPMLCAGTRYRKMIG